jgi:tetratricopeptide (TPR) repeat protein
MDNPVGVLDGQDKCEAAEEMYQRALESRERVLGPEHADTLTSMDDLAAVLYSQDKYEAAEEMYRRILELRERVLGPEHADTLTSMDDLAVVLRVQGKYEAAEEMRRREEKTDSKAYVRDLDATTHEIRLLEFEPFNKQDQLIRMTTRYRSLDEWCSYDALSYTWSDPVQKNFRDRVLASVEPEDSSTLPTIHVNNEELQVTPNLYAAL